VEYISRRIFFKKFSKQSRDFCYVDNVVAANILAMKTRKNFNGEAFNIAHGERITINDVKRLIEKYSEKKLILENRLSRIGDVQHTHADVSKAKKWFGYEPRIKFEEGLRRTVEWFETRLV